MKKRLCTLLAGLILCVTAALAQVQKVTGTVIAQDDGEPVMGASITVEGTKQVAITDSYGVFTIGVPPGKKIVVSYIGMTTVTVTPKDGMKIVLKNDSKMLDDVVITGIFQKARESYTGSVSTIKAEDIKLNRGSNLLQTLKSLDASLNFGINNVVGSNPNSLPQLNIRGTSSLPIRSIGESASNAVNTPLIIMDGFEISLTKLMDYNDDEIASINILKDAAATAIYGSRGANGVIVVNSRKPEPGKLRVNVDAGVTLEIPDLSSYDLLDAAGKLKLEYDAGLYDDNNPTRQEEKRAVYFRRLKDVLSGVNTDWLSYPTRTGVGQRYNLRLEGGNNEFRWGTALSYNDIQGAMKGSYRRTFNGSITLMYTYKNLQFRNYTTLGFNGSKESNYGSFATYAYQQPYYAPYGPDGKLNRYFPTFYDSPGDIPRQNPLYDATLNSFNKSGYQEITNNFSIDWYILPELNLRGQFGISVKDGTTDRFRSPKSSDFTGREYNTSDGFLRRGTYDFATSRYMNYSGDLTLSYNKTFNDRHQLYAGLNYSIRESTNRNYAFKAEGFSNDSMSDIMNARQYVKNGKPSGSKTKSRMLGLTGNINYTYDNRYYVDASYRVDGSSEFGSNNRYAPFWSTGIGWNLHNEKFMKNKTPFNSLRLKTSYGETGSLQSLGSGANTIYRFQTDSQYRGWIGAMLSGLGNADLTWQTTKQFNIGTEFGLWEDRIRGSFEVYTKNTSDLLSSMDLPRSTGFSSYLANIGEVQNKGWEAYINAYIIRNEKKRFNWMVGAQLVHNTNKITKLSDAIKEQNKVAMSNIYVNQLYFEGYPQNSIYAVRSAGIDPSSGEEVFIDRNGNYTNRWDPLDKVFMGSSDPKYQGLFNTLVMWKNFTAKVTFTYHWGNKVYNNTLLDKVEVTLGRIQSGNVDERVLSTRWFKPGDVTFFRGLSDNETLPTSRYVMTDNVLELSSLSLEYRLDSKQLRNLLGLNYMIFAINTTDLFHLSSIKMERGVGYPYARTFIGSIKLAF